MTSVPTSLLGAWRPLNGIPPEQLRDARLQAHWAIQAVASVGHTLAEPQSDTSHTSMTWLDGAGLFVGVPGRDGYGAALRLRDLTLVVLDADRVTFGTLSLDGETLDDAMAWLGETIGVLSGRRPALELPTHDLPDHPTGRGQRFSMRDMAPLEQLVRWYSDAWLVEENLARSTPGAAPVRCWPHHFDIATLIEIDDDPQEGRSINLGMSPGDTHCEEPYFYVTPHPATAEKELPALHGGGVWHRKEWTGAMMPGE